MDSLITKGYRLEKRFVALDCRPVRFFCSKCEKLFTMGEKESVHRHKREYHHHITTRGRQTEAGRQTGS